MPAERDIYIHLPWQVLELCHAVEKCSEKTFSCNFSCLQKHEKGGKQPTLTECSVRVYRDVWDIMTLQATGVDKAVSPLSESCHFYLSDVVTETRYECPDESAASQRDEEKSPDKSSADDCVEDEEEDESVDDDDFVSLDMTVESPAPESTKPEEKPAEISHNYNTRRRSKLLGTPDTQTAKKTPYKTTFRVTPMSVTKTTTKAVTKATTKTVTKATSQKITAEVSDVELTNNKKCSPVLKKRVYDDSSEKCELCGKYLKNTNSLYSHILWSHQNHPLCNSYKTRVSKCLYQQCHECKKRVFGVSGLVQHMERVHNKKNDPVTCPICKTELKNKHTFVDHLRKTHKLNSHERRLRFGMIPRVSPDDSLQIRKSIKKQERSMRGVRKTRRGVMEGDSAEEEKGGDESATYHTDPHDTSLDSDDTSPSKHHTDLNHSSDTQNDSSRETVMSDGTNEISGVKSEKDKQTSPENSSPVTSTDMTQRHGESEKTDQKATDCNVDNRADEGDAAVGVDSTVMTADNGCEQTGDECRHDDTVGSESTQQPEADENPDTKPAKRVKLNLTEQEMEKFVVNSEVKVGRRAEQNVCCTICNRWLKSSYSVYCHMSAEHRNHPDLEEHRKPVYAQCRTQCNECGKMFGNPNLFRAHHRRFHAKEAFQPVKCNMCSVTCRNAVCLKDHIAKHHVEHRNACNHCPVSFAKPHQLRMHEHIRHNMHPELADKIYRFICEYCDKRFYSSASHQKHMNSHRGIKPHLCDHCGRSFSGYESLRKHRVKVHNIGSAEDDVRIAEEIAKPFTCQMCDSKFSEREELNDHMMKTHSISPRFSCPECELRFFSADELKLHLEETHALICSLCGTCLLGPSELTEHLRIVHNAVAAEEVVFDDSQVAQEDGLEVQEVQVYLPQGDTLSDNVVVLCTMDTDEAGADMETVTMVTESAAMEAESAGIDMDNCTITTETVAVESGHIDGHNPSMVTEMVAMEAEDVAMDAESLSVKIEAVTEDGTVIEGAFLGD